MTFIFEKSLKEHIYSLNNILNLNNIFIAKEKLYNVILKNIKKIHPNFNIGISTGDRGDVRNRWFDAYRHWNFIAKNAEFDKTLTKKNKNSIISTKYFINNDKTSI